MEKASLRFLSDEDVRRIHSTELEILESIGVRVDHQEALQMLEEAGAKVNLGEKTVRIPPDLVGKCLEKAPDDVVFAGRNKEDDKILGPQQQGPYTRSSSGTETYVDPVTGQARKASIEDIENWIRLQDALDYDFCTSVYPDPDEVPIKIRDIRIMEVAFNNTRKHFAIGPYGETSLKYMIELALAVRGGKEELKKRPIFSILIASVSPLEFPPNQVEMILMGSKYGIPLLLLPMPIAGATAPNTIAGVATIAGAELLAMNVIAQLAKPNTPVVYAPRSGYLDMYRAVMALGVGWAMIATVEVQMAKEIYGIPVDVHGPASSSIIPDAQAMIESVLDTICPALAGANLLGGAGCLEAGITVDPIQLVMANEINRMVIDAVKGFDVTDDTIGMDVIREVGIGGEFLTHKHTLKFTKMKEFYKCPIFNLKSRDGWEKEGAKDMSLKARDKAIRIIKEHRLEPLDENVQKELRSIVYNAEREIK